MLHGQPTVDELLTISGPPQNRVMEGGQQERRASDTRHTVEKVRDCEMFLAGAKCKFVWKHDAA